MTPEALPDPLRVALAVSGILGRLGIPYVITGSFASSVHGEPRSTDDVDVVADVGPAHVSPLTAAFGAEWYVSEEAVREAIAAGTSFNAIHLPTGVKVDLFVVGKDAFDARRVAAAHLVRIGDPPVALRIDSAEHILLRKLEWFRRGGETSDRQWRDVLGIVRTQGPRLDRAELDTWADRLGVADLLRRARDEAG